MAKNVQEEILEHQLIFTVKKLVKQMEQLRGTQTIFVIPLLSSDPSSPLEGQMWENTSTHHLKIYLNGSVQTIL